jgi:signal transduction histidine kinase
VGEGEFAGDRQPEARASAVPSAGRPQLSEPFEDPLMIGLGDSRAVVGDAELGVVVAAVHVDLDGMPSVSLSVVQQIGEQPGELGADGADDHAGVEPEPVGEPIRPPGDLTIRVCNPAAERLFARPTGELVGTQLGFPAVTAEASEIDLMLPGGGERVVEWRVSTTTLEGERLYVAVLREVTSRRQVERDLEAALERQNLVVAVAAHELNNPLAAVNVLVHVLHDRLAALAEEQKAEIIDRIADRMTRVQALVRKLLTASIIDTRGVRADLERVQVLQSMIERLGEFDERSQDVHLSCDPGLVALVDRDEFSEMLANYLENAFAYGDPPIGVFASRRGDWIEIRVCDRGPGVPEAFVPRLFERFSREPGVEQRTEGTGLGLWIVHNLMRANGGDAWYEPGADRGACFCLRLKRAPAT